MLIKYGASSPVVNDLSRPDRAKRARRRIILRSLARFALFRDWVGAVFVRAPGLFSYVPLLSLPKLVRGALAGVRVSSYSAPVSSVVEGFFVCATERSFEHK